MRGVGWGLLVLTLVGVGVGSTIGFQKLQEKVKGSSDSSSSNATSQSTTSSSSSSTSAAALALSLPKYEASSTTTYKAISATIAPDNATFKTITWSVSDSTCIGFSATDGGSTSSAITSESGQTIYLKCLKAFAGTVNVVSASQFNLNLKATCACTYYNQMLSTTWEGFGQTKDGAVAASGSFTDGASHGATWTGGTTASPSVTMFPGTWIYAHAVCSATDTSLTNPTMQAMQTAIATDVRVYDEGPSWNQDTSPWVEVQCTSCTPYWDGSDSIPGKYLLYLAIYYNFTYAKTFSLTDNGKAYLTLTINPGVAVSSLAASTSSTSF